MSVSSIELVTQTAPPAAAIASGLRPTGIAETIRPVRGLILDTVSPNIDVTQTAPLAGGDRLRDEASAGSSGQATRGRVDTPDRASHGVACHPDGPSPTATSSKLRYRGAEIRSCGRGIAAASLGSPLLSARPPCPRSRASRRRTRCPRTGGDRQRAVGYNPQLGEEALVFLSRRRSELTTCSIASATATVFPSVATPVGVPFADELQRSPVFGSTRQTACPPRSSPTRSDQLDGDPVRLVARRDRLATVFGRDRSGSSESAVGSSSAAAAAAGEEEAGESGGDQGDTHGGDGERPAAALGLGDPERLPGVLDQLTAGRVAPSWFLGERFRQHLLQPGQDRRRIFELGVEVAASDPRLNGGRPVRHS